MRDELLTILNEFEGASNPNDTWPGLSNES